MFPHFIVKVLCVQNPLKGKNSFQVLRSENNECVFSRGTPTHSRQTLSLPLPTPVPASCCVVIYEAEELMEEPPEEFVLAQVIFFLLLYFS